jgi:hypothetical protein
MMAVGRICGSAIKRSANRDSRSRSSPEGKRLSSGSMSACRQSAATIAALAGLLAQPGEVSFGWK